LIFSRTSPVPPRTELLIATRDAHTDARRPVELLREYYQANPEHYPTHPAFDLEVYDFPLQWAAIQREIDRQLEPMVRQYDQALAEQDWLTRRVRLAMPVPLALETFNDLAGSGLHRHQRFTEQVLLFHDEHRAFYEPLIFSKTSLTRDDYDWMPTFVFAEEGAADTARRVLPALLALSVVAGLVFAGAALGYRSSVRRSA
jgi:hypothetical protein